MRREDLMAEFTAELRAGSLSLKVWDGPRPGGLASELVVEIPSEHWHAALLKMKSLGGGMRLVFLAAGPDPWGRIAFLEDASGEVQVVALAKGHALQSVADVWPWAKHLEQEAEGFR